MELGLRRAVRLSERRRGRSNPRCFVAEAMAEVWRELRLRAAEAATTAAGGEAL